MKTRDQFIANGREIPEISEFIGADTLGYLSMAGLIKALTPPRDDLCLGCLTGEYPVAIPGEKVRGMRPLETFAARAPRASAERRPRSTSAAGPRARPRPA